MTTKTLVFAMGLLCGGAMVMAEPDRPPKDGYVPNERTAIAIGVAVAENVFGKGLVEKQKPHQAELEKGVWMVSGSLPPPEVLPNGDRKVWVGGTFEVFLNKSDGRILKVIHSLYGLTSTG
ncbi:MAG: hypothetical protein JNJ45_10085 [Chthonomonas sp.]|nr:hypothetical protein [Chthonomonas sp.]